MHIVSGELRKAPFIKAGVGQDGQSVMFAVELSEVIKDYKTGEKTYTNYKALMFAKGAQVDYYNSVLIEGNFIVVSAEKLKIEVSECGKYTKLAMENARLADAKYVAPQQQAQQAPQQQGGFQQQASQQNFAPQQQAQQAPQQQGGFQQQAPQQNFAPQQQAQQQGGYAPQQGFAPQQGNNPQF